MLKDEFLEIIGHPRNFNFLKERGYDVVIKKPIMVKYTDVMPGSTIKVVCICDNCHSENSNVFKDYYSYTDGFKQSYFCKKCRAVKSKETNLKKYGVDNPMKLDCVKNTLKISLLNKYGVSHYSKTDEFKEKYKNTCLKKYGVDNSSKLTLIKEKISNIRLKDINSIDKYQNIIDSSLYEILSYDGKLMNIKHYACDDIFSINRMNLYDRLNVNKEICTKCSPISSDNISISENEVKKWLLSIDIEIVCNDYNIIKPLSLDIYLPKYKIAIEFNGVYWHSELYKENKYHINKSTLCNNIGIELIHIWEDDWNLKKNIIMSIILNRINMIDNKIFARKCDIRAVKYVESKKFLNENHIIGSAKFNIAIGLYHNNELISLMLFGKNRKEFELIRFCNKINTLVVGAASKLFKYFLKYNNVDMIVSYSDISIFSGNLYEKLGFHYVHTTKPNYWWVIDGIRKHRFGFNKKILVKSGYDQNKTEVEIMHGLGYYRIFGCGQKKWVYTKH